MSQMLGGQSRKQAVINLKQEPDKKKKYTKGNDPEKEPDITLIFSLTRAII